MKVRAAAFVICLASCAARVLGQSLIDSARLKGESSGSVTDICGPMPSLAEVMSQSDLVVHGRVVDVKARLSADQTQVNTEYTIAPIQAFKTGVLQLSQHQAPSPRSWRGARRHFVDRRRPASLDVGQQLPGNRKLYAG
jgi:hypothetical protein